MVARAELMVAKAFRRASSIVARHGAARALAAAAHFASHGDLFDFTASFQFADVSIAPMQIREEYVAFLDLVAAEQPRTVIEIGTARGGTLFMLTRVVPSDALLVGIDYAVDGGERFGGNTGFSRRASLYRSFAMPGQKIEFLFADSHAPETVATVERLLPKRAVDLLFIDGDHSEAGVRADFEMYAPLVRQGGLIAFHDIVPGPEEDVGGVPTVWRDLKDERAREIVDDWRQGGYGIGVLRWEA